MIHPQTTTSLSKGEEDLTEVKVEAEAEIADLRMSKKKLFCHFHGTDSDHTANQCPEKKKKTSKEWRRKKRPEWSVTLAGPPRSFNHPTYPNKYITQSLHTFHLSAIVHTLPIGNPHTQSLKEHLRRHPTRHHLKKSSSPLGPPPK